MKWSVKLTGIFVTIALMLSIILIAAFPGNTANYGLTPPGESINNGPVNISANNGGTTADKIKASIILYVGSPVAYVNGIEKRIDMENIEVTPAIIDNTEMVPVRFIAESLGGTVQWDRRNLTASIMLDNRSYQFTQGSETMVTGQKRIPLGAKVQAHNGRIFVPLDQFVEILGMKAFYDRGLIVISNEKNIFDPVKDKALISEWISKLSYLPVVGSHEKLICLLEEGQKNGTRSGRLIKGMTIDQDVMFDGAMNGAVMNEAEAAQSTAAGSDLTAAKAKSSEAAAAAGAGDYSTTNVQVQGVDEGDIVKTDGNYIYQVNKNRVVITEVKTPEKMKVVSTIQYENKNIRPQEIYLHGQKLVVIGSSRAYIPIVKNKAGIQAEIYPSPRSYQSSVKVLIYDLSDKSNAKLLREVELEGGYVSSRKIGSALYLVANDYIDYYRIQDGDMNDTPSYRDTKSKDGYVNIGYDAIRYFPGLVDSNYMVVAGIPIDGNEAANVSTYLGAGENIYASAENLYVAVTGYSDGSAKSSPGEHTQLYKFGLKEAKLTYLCKGEVPGTVLNQFSMDEDKGYFRIATTKGNTWSTNERISKNALYVLDSMLSVTGKIEDMAPGEKIYSVRFMQDRAYVVTFKTVDPLFVIDLKNPVKPAILGALKIPGYSDYLHPYDENHIIGFGKDTTEIKGQAYYLGMKVALFDVTDVSNPIQKFSEKIGDRGTDSELLSNHKALLFSKEKNLLAFPVTLMEVKGSSEKEKADSLQYGEFTFQGALVYNLDLQKGFKLKGRITHLSDEDYLKAGRDWYNSDKNIQRIIYIGDNLYTLSNGLIKANAMVDLKEKGSVVIP